MSGALIKDMTTSSTNIKLQQKTTSDITTTMSELNNALEEVSEAANTSKVIPIKTKQTEEDEIIYRYVSQHTIVSKRY